MILLLSMLLLLISYLVDFDSKTTAYFQTRVNNLLPTNCKQYSFEFLVSARNLYKNFDLFTNISFISLTLKNKIKLLRETASNKQQQQKQPSNKKP